MVASYFRYLVGARNSCFVMYSTLIDKGEEEWLLLTDTDDFVSYNFVQPRENISYFDKNSIFHGPRAPSLEKRAAYRVKALTIR
jgi:hypothetical protein